jgi:hypothetical protein
MTSESLVAQGDNGDREESARTTKPKSIRRGFERRPSRLSPFRGDCRDQSSLIHRTGVHRPAGETLTFARY